MYDERRERRKMRVLLGVAFLASLVLLAMVIPSPYIIERPGPVVNTLGDVMIKNKKVPVIGITDDKTYPTTGVLNLLTVSIVGGPEHPASWLSLLPAVVDPSQRIAPQSEFFPEGETEKGREAQNTALMNNSQMQAAAAAFRQLKRPVSVQLYVADVSDKGPSKGVLRTGDVLLGVNGKRVTDFAKLRQAVIASGADMPMQLAIERDGKEQDVAVTPRIPEGGKEPMIGAVLSLKYQLPAQVDIHLSEIGGPSAGMVFALGIYDQLTPEPLLDGLTVSGTGTISDSGQVGPIGGLAQKMWGAQRAGSDLFLMPIENCNDLSTEIPSGMTVAPVETLDEAIKAIETLRSGGVPAGIERCKARKA